MKSKTFTSPDGTTWRVDVRNPGASNAMIVFRHPDGRTSRLDRYNWIISQGPEARSVTARLSAPKMLDHLNAQEIAALFRRSMPVSRPDPFNRPEPTKG